jgi:hypothetical protein
MKEYEKKPERKAYKKEYDKKPERKAYQKEYRQTPERKAYKKKYDAVRYARKKAETQSKGTLDAFLK